MLALVENAGIMDWATVSGTGNRPVNTRGDVQRRGIDFNGQNSCVCHHASWNGNECDEFWLSPRTRSECGRPLLVQGGAAAVGDGTKWTLRSRNRKETSRRRQTRVSGREPRANTCHAVGSTKDLVDDEVQDEQVLQRYRRADCEVMVSSPHNFSHDPCKGLSEGRPRTW